ncbi:hypothetical protein ACFVQB_07065 [Paenibacillus sp. NPDC057886]|uniref:hypothetical protein n=1 Tax=Paenibacillus sp. NPDC057886 TaxID=3346270 RepID=UPI0036B99A0D
MIAASEAIRANGIRIDTIGIGHNVLLPEYLDATASSGQAFIVPLEITNAQDALRDQMLAVTSAELVFFENVVITDMVPRRSIATPSQLADGTFTLDMNSLQVAFEHTPNSPLLFQPVNLSNGLVSVTLEEDRYIIVLHAGNLWAPEEAVLQEGRFFKAIIAFNLIPNPGVISRSGENVPDIPTNIEASVRWMEADVERTLSSPPAFVFVPAFCTPQPPIIVEPEVPPGAKPQPPVVDIIVEPENVPPGEETTVTVTVQNKADRSIEMRLHIHLPIGFQYIHGSLVDSKRLNLVEKLDNIDLGVNQPEEVETICFRLAAPHDNLFKHYTIYATVCTVLGDATASADIQIEEEAE